MTFPFCFLRVFSGYGRSVVIVFIPPERICIGEPPAFALELPTALVAAHVHDMVFPHLHRLREDVDIQAFPAFTPLNKPVRRIARASRGPVPGASSAQYAARGSWERGGLEEFPGGLSTHIRGFSIIVLYCLELVDVSMMERSA